MPWPGDSDRENKMPPYDPNAPLTWERVITAGLIGAVIGVVALLANHHIPKLTNGGNK